MTSLTGTATPSREPAAGLSAARTQVAESEAATPAAIARGESQSATVNDTALKSPISARVLYRLTEPGEVLAAGSKLLTLLNMTDVSMTVFLPAAKGPLAARRVFCSMPCPTSCCPPP